jgi:hypothetical protein
MVMVSKGSGSFAKVLLTKYHGVNPGKFPLCPKELAFRYNNRNRDLFTIWPKYCWLSLHEIVLSYYQKKSRLPGIKPGENLLIGHGHDIINGFLRGSIHPSDSDDISPFKIDSSLRLFDCSRNIHHHSGTGSYAH